ncbi:MAG: penicillin-binding protein 2 [Alphaproteobacteria bacterium]|nr:penicillin-binding protein 2 [Alphaproteobacteria bacterium]
MRTRRLPYPHRAVAVRRRQRAMLAAGLFAAAFATVVMRLFVIATEAQQVATTAPVRSAATTLTRADIVDRDGRLLATEVPVDALYADARHIWDPKEAAAALVSILPELDEASLERKLSSGLAFVWIKRDLTPAQYAQVRSLGIAGLGVRRETKRVYPVGRTAAHVVGFVDIDNRGLAGVERALDQRLRDPARGGAPLTLSLDLRVQHVVADELAAASEEFRAVGATGIVLDVHSGEVLAMASVPDFDPNHPADSPAETRFNRATLGVYEMGSTFKTFTTAMALDAGVVTIRDGFDASQPIRIGRFTISDYHPEARWLSVPEIFQYSSNIGSARMAMATGPERQRAYLSRFGLLSAPAIEIAEVAPPLLPPQWGPVETMTISFGHGLAVSPLQTATAMAAMVNGGLMIPPTILKRSPEGPVRAKRVISEDVSASMRTLLRLVVSEGTGGKADVIGYPVGGKTGTAEKAQGGRYARKALLSSFVGVFPALQPRYLVLVLLDEPQPTAETHGYATGGWTAAPTCGRIIARIAPMLGLIPEDQAVAGPSDGPQIAVVNDQ